MTYNSNWSEIFHELRPGEEANDRPDLTSKVFNMKLNALLKDLLQNGVLGIAMADIHVVEWQKRGLAHGHILIILRSQDKSRDSNDYDRIGYPKTFQPQTEDSTGNYPTYRRWDDGRTFTHPTSGFVFYNRWVVPYNPYLTMRYQCHINVEVYSSITAVKYLYKYDYKGHDRAFAMDEVQNYLDGWYVSANKACHRFFAFDLHDMHPNVYHLVVHLPNEQTTYFLEETTVGEAMMRNNSTTLTRWCDFN
ncbi:hypothetical protein BDL97_18G013900 [Sphagnum fallax]|nr:hypothetical protein BDL97_18G013900 [Sphagnum fallax]